MAAGVMVGVVVLVGCGFGARSELLRRHRTRHVRPLPEPHSLVRVLTDEGDLRDAVERAVGYEEAVARAVTDRIEHYRSLSCVASVVPLVRDLDDSRIPPSDGVRDSA